MNHLTLTARLLAVRPETFRRHSWRETSTAAEGVTIERGLALDHNGLIVPGPVLVRVRRPNTNGLIWPAFVAPRRSRVHHRLATERNVGWV